MTENDYIAEYVKERCPELLDTMDYKIWKLEKAVSEALQTLVDGIKAIDWNKVPNDEQMEIDELQGKYSSYYDEASQHTRELIQQKIDKLKEVEQ